MREIGAFDAKNRLGQLLDLVEAGDEIIITRRGKPVARLGPPVAFRSAGTSLEVASRIRERRRGVTLGGIPIKALIEEGRR